MILKFNKGNIILDIQNSFTSKETSAIFHFYYHHNNAVFQFVYQNAILEWNQIKNYPLKEHKILRSLRWDNNYISHFVECESWPVFPFSADSSSSFISLSSLDFGKGEFIFASCTICKSSALFEQPLFNSTDGLKIPSADSSSDIDGLSISLQRDCWTFSSSNWHVFTTGVVTPSSGVLFRLFNCEITKIRIQTIYTLVSWLHLHKLAMVEAFRSSIVNDGGLKFPKVYR